MIHVFTWKFNRFELTTMLLSIFMLNRNCSTVLFSSKFMNEIFIRKHGVKLFNPHHSITASTHLHVYLWLIVCCTSQHSIQQLTICNVLCIGSLRNWWVCQTSISDSNHLLRVEPYRIVSPSQFRVLFQTELAVQMWL